MDLNVRYMFRDHEQGSNVSELNKSYNQNLQSQEFQQKVYRANLKNFKELQELENTTKRYNHVMRPCNLSYRNIESRQIDEINEAVEKEKLGVQLQKLVNMQEENAKIEDIAGKTRNFHEEKGSQLEMAQSKVDKIKAIMDIMKNNNAKLEELKQVSQSLLKYLRCVEREKLLRLAKDYKCIARSSVITTRDNIYKIVWESIEVLEWDLNYLKNLFCVVTQQWNLAHIKVDVRKLFKAMETLEAGIETQRNCFKNMCCLYDEEALEEWFHIKNNWQKELESHRALIITVVDDLSQQVLKEDVRILKSRLSIINYNEELLDVLEKLKN